jgi:hypothetical protein
MIRIHFPKKKLKNMSSKALIQSQSQVSLKSIYRFFVIDLESQLDYRSTATIKTINSGLHDFGVVLNPSPNVAFKALTYIIKPEYYLISYPMGKVVYLLIFYDLKYLVLETAYTKFLDWLSWIFQMTHQHYRYFMISETNSLAYPTQYVERLIEAITPIKHKLILVMPNYIDPTSFTSGSTSTEEYNGFNHFLVGSASTLNDITLDAESESYATVLFTNDRISVQTHTIDQHDFDYQSVIHFISKMQQLEELFEKHTVLYAQGNRSQMIDLSVNLVLEATAFLAIEKYIATHNCLYSYITNIATKCAKTKDLYRESLQRVFINELLEKLHWLRRRIYQQRKF